MQDQAVQAFDAVAEAFDQRYGPWRSVSAQRRIVRDTLLTVFPRGARVLEIGGGTGEDALWLAQRGREVLLTDAAPSMVRIAREKTSAQSNIRTAVVPAEGLESLARTRDARGEPLFDGAYSNFAALNCVADLGPVARGLAQLLRPGSSALLVLFGTCPPGEVIVQLAKGNVRAAFRRLRRGDVPARLGGRDFFVRYHRPRDVTHAMQPWFRLIRRRGVGVFVPPSAAEPWISKHPKLLGMLEALDGVASDPLAPLGDHVLYHFERTAAPVTVPVAADHA